MKKIIFRKFLVCFLTPCVLLTVLAGFGNINVAAKNNEEVKLKVFVHYPKPDGGKPQAPVCQATVNDHAITYGATGWKLPNSAVVYQINYNSKPSNLSSANVMSSIVNSFQAWATGTVSFIEGAPSAVGRYQYDRINLVAWGSVPNSAIAVTYTWYYPSTSQWLESDTILNNKLKWAWTPYSADCAGSMGAYDVQNIMTHENGHWVGLDDLYDSNSRDLTMYGYGMTSELKKDTLGWGDILGEKTIYGF